MYKTSSFSDGLQCVAVERDGDTVRLKHSKKDGAVLEFTNGEFDAFLAGVRAGEFDDA